jgi:hypothetical protein
MMGFVGPQARMLPVIFSISCTYQWLSEEQRKALLTYKELLPKCKSLSSF